MTSFSPDQVSSIAQTFTSTRPLARAMERITSSVTSVGTLEAFFGQEIQIMPLGMISAFSEGSSFFNCCASLVK